jgi:hypothetical protein
MIHHIVTKCFLWDQRWTRNQGEDVLTEDKLDDIDT